MKGSDWTTSEAVKFTEATTVRSSHFPTGGSAEVCISYGLNVVLVWMNQHRSHIMLAGNKTGQLEET